MDRRIINNVLSSFEKKIVQRKEIIKRFKEILGDHYHQNIIRNLRHSNDILYILYDYYYIVSPLEKSEHYLEYSTNEMLYVVLNNLSLKWYHGLDSALEYNQVIWQGVVNPVIINNYLSGKRKVNGVTYRFHKMKSDLLTFGKITKKTKNNIPFYFSDTEKTYLDFLYLKGKAPRELKQRIQWKTTQRYLKKYPSSLKHKVFYT